MGETESGESPFLERDAVPSLEEADARDFYRKWIQKAPEADLLSVKPTHGTVAWLTFWIQPVRCEAEDAPEPYLDF